MQISDSIWTAIAYADVFDYPLTREEVLYWLPVYCRNKRVHPPKGISVVHTTAGEYWTFQERTRCVKKREERQRQSLEKWTLVHRVVSSLSWIPTVTLIGITGGVSMNNASVDDDIDVCIVARAGSVWITRFFATLLLDCLGIRRKPHQQEVKNVFCLNMFLSEDGLCVPRQFQDLFSAHEVLQMVPVFDRGGIYGEFLWQNRWVTAFIPNAWKEKSWAAKRTPIRRAGVVARCIETVFRCVQVWYMNRNRTTEYISKTMILFHPRDARLWVRKKFAQRLKRMNVPLDNIFLHR